MLSKFFFMSSSPDKAIVFNLGLFTLQLIYRVCNWTWVYILFALESRCLTFRGTVEYGYIENGYIEKRIYRTDFDFPARALLCKTKFPTDISKTDISKNGYIEHVFDFLTTDISNWPLRFFFKFDQIVYIWIPLYSSVLCSLYRHQKSTLLAY